MRRVSHYFSLSLLCCFLTLFGVFFQCVKAAAATQITFRFFQYTSSEEDGNLFSRSYDLHTGLNQVHYDVNKKISYTFIVFSGFNNGITYEFNITDMQMYMASNGSDYPLILKDAYIQSNNGNLSIANSINLSNYSYSGNFSIDWTEKDNSVVFYFEPTSVDLDKVASRITFRFNGSVLASGYGGDVSGIEDNTSQTAQNTSGILNTIGNVLTEIIDLPSKIVHALGDFVRDLVVPDPDDLHTVIENFKSSMSSKLGFVYQVYTLAYNFFNGLSASHSGVIHFPGISFPMGNTTYVIAQPQDVDITQNELASTLLPICKTVISMIMVVWVVNLGLKSFLDMTSGKWG